MAKCEKCELFTTSIAGNYSAVQINGVGNSDADIMIIGEAPGADEVKQRKPFVGQAGQLLRTVISSVGISSDEVFITTVCKCRPPKNRTPKPKEMKACFPYTEQEIEDVKPKVIGLLGAVACKAFGVTGKITSIHGSKIWSEKYDCWLVPVYHPNYVMRFTNQAPQRTHFVEDLRKLVTLTGKTKEGQTLVYKVADTIEKVKKARDYLLKQKEFSFDVETNSLDFLKSSVICVSFSAKEDTALVIPFQHPEIFNEKEQEIVRKCLKEILENNILKCAQNGKFDIKHLRHQDIFVQKYYFDTMLAHFMLDEEGLHSLDVLTQIYTDISDYKDELKDYLKVSDENGINSILECPIDKLFEYAAKDANATLVLKNILLELLKKEDLEELFFKSMMPVCFILADMEYNGITVDKEYVDKTTAIFKYKMKSLENDLQKDKYVKKHIEMVYEKKLEDKKPNSRKKIEREPFKFNSCKQLRELLFGILEIVPIKYTKPSKTSPKGNPSTDKEVLEELAKKTRFEVLENLLKYRKAKKMMDYIAKYKELAEQTLDGRVHTTYLQSRARTGRLASKDPNLQNIPSVDRDPDNARLVRNCLIAEEGKVLVEFDYSQMEFRIWADNSDDKEMISIINNDDEDFDIHKYVASKIFCVDYEEVTKLQRSLAKGVVYGLMYGRGLWSIAQEFGISNNEAERIQQGFYKLFPKATQWMEDQVKFLREHGYVVNMFGRRRRLSDVFHTDTAKVSHAERQAKNHPIQSGSADIVYKAMIALFRKYRYVDDIKLLLQIHDSVVFEMTPEALERECSTIMSIMETVVKLKVPMPVDGKYGKKLGEMQKIGV